VAGAAAEVADAAAAEVAGAGAVEVGAAAAEVAGAGAVEVGAAEVGAAEVAAEVAEPAPEPVLSVAGGGGAEDAGALVPEAAPLTADVAWETACPNADDKPPADDESLVPGLDAAEAEPAERTESPMARPMAATATPAPYRHRRRTLVTTR